MTSEIVGLGRGEKRLRDKSRAGLCQGGGGRESTGERKEREKEVVYCMERVRTVQYILVRHACPEEQYMPVIV